MTQDEKVALANRILSDHLADGIEYIAVYEGVADLTEDEIEVYTDGDVQDVYDLVQNALLDLSRSPDVESV